MSSASLNLLHDSFTGRSLIEASAGTGKTWTIAMLYVRLVLGHDRTAPGLAGTSYLPPDILVLTFTEAAAVRWQGLSPRQQEAVLQAYFGHPQGHGYTLCRVHMNSCDFALGNYAHADVPGDTALEHFSIARDEQALLPFIQAAQRVASRPIRLLVSPWSPPAWMKTNSQMNQGGQLRPECRNADHRADGRRHGQGPASGRSRRHERSCRQADRPPTTRRRAEPMDSRAAGRRQARHSCPRSHRLSLLGGEPRHEPAVPCQGTAASAATNAIPSESACRNRKWVGA